MRVHERLEHYFLNKKYLYSFRLIISTMRNTKAFQEAAEAFHELEQLCLNDGSAEIPNSFLKHVATASYALATLNLLGRDKLLDLERQEIVHPSTVSGGSLASTIDSLRAYWLMDDREYYKDDYEQLARTCHSAKKVYDNDIL